MKTIEKQITLNKEKMRKLFSQPNYNSEVLNKIANKTAKLERDLNNMREN